MSHLMSAETHSNSTRLFQKFSTYLLQMLHIVHHQREPVEQILPTDGPQIREHPPQSVQLHHPKQQQVVPDLPQLGKNVLKIRVGLRSLDQHDLEVALDSRAAPKNP